MFQSLYSFWLLLIRPYSKIDATIFVLSACVLCFLMLPDPFNNEDGIKIITSLATLSLTCSIFFIPLHEIRDSRLNQDKKTYSLKELKNIWNKCDTTHIQQDSHFSICRNANTILVAIFINICILLYVIFYNDYSITSTSHQTQQYFLDFFNDKNLNYFFRFGLCFILSLSLHPIYRTILLIWEISGMNNKK